MAYPYTINTRATGTVVTAAIWTADHQQHVDNQIPSSTDDQSTNLAAMQTTRDPYPAGAPSLAVTLAEELQSLRYQIAQITGQSYWYVDTPPLQGKAYRYGLTLSNNAGDATNDIDIAAGEAANATGAVKMALAAGITKRLDATWAAGTGNGGRSSTVALANTTYFVFLIRVGGADDVGFDTSVTGANLVTDHSATHVRRIGAILREGAAIVPFVQTDARFDRKIPISSYDVTNPGTAAVLVPLHIPIGLKMTAIIGFACNATAAGGEDILITDPATTDTAPSSTVFNFRVSTSQVGGATFHITTDASGQIRFRYNTSDAGVIIRAATIGWIDHQLDLGT